MIKTNDLSEVTKTGELLTVTSTYYNHIAQITGKVNLTTVVDWAFIGVTEAHFNDKASLAMSELHEYLRNR